MPCWLMKAEPETRLEKGIDVKFSIDDLEAIGTSKWDGVRNHEAKNIMKTKMKLGDKVLFYHSNCKVPGVYGLAAISKEGYPDYTAWDPKHPYYHEASKESNPTWFMVDVTFSSKIAHPVTLALLKHVVALAEVPECIDYIGQDGLEALKGMVLVNRGRLSVQPVSDSAYDTIVLMGERGGWDDLLPSSSKSKGKKRKADEDAGDEPEQKAEVSGVEKVKKTKRAVESEAPVKKATSEVKKNPQEGTRRSARVRGDAALA